MWSALETAACNGLIAAHVDLREATTFLFGPLLFAHVAESDDTFADRIVDRFLAAFAP